MFFRKGQNEQIFASEIMVQPSKNNVYFPERLVSEALEVERMILQIGFKIIYFTLKIKKNDKNSHS